jgi:hypothetical protein
VVGLEGRTSRGAGEVKRRGSEVPGVIVGREAAAGDEIRRRSRGPRIHSPTLLRFSSASRATRSFSFRFSSLSCRARAFARSRAVNSGPWDNGVIEALPAVGGREGSPASPLPPFSSSFSLLLTSFSLLSLSSFLSSTRLASGSQPSAIPQRRILSPSTAEEGDRNG